MGAALIRASFSPNIKERRDLSCALFDARGRMIAQAAHLPVHLGSAPLSVQAAIAAVPMQPDDAVLLNDPYQGGTHLPDLTLVSPVFLAGERRPSFYVANRAHHADVGGAAPGSMAPARDIHGEGLRIPPLKLVRGGRFDRPILELLLANMRVPREREADLDAQWAANRAGARRLAELCAEHGRAVLVRRAAELLEWSARACRAELALLPRGRFEVEDVLEVPGASRDGLARIRLRLELARSGATFDFRTTDDQLESPLNTVHAVVVSAVLYALRLLLPAHTPTNDGVLAPVRVRTRRGSLVDACYPAPVAAGNVETSQRLVDVILAGFDRALPGRLPAASSGTMANLSFGGHDARGAAFTYYETIAGGAGAGPERDGQSAVHTHMTNTRNTPIEAFELAFPARVERLDVRRGSGGRGARRGGDGVEKVVRFLAPVRGAWVAERSLAGPIGRAGGARGACSEAELALDGAPKRRLGSKAAFDAPAGARLTVRTPGGGGHGGLSPAP
ncbi:MAG: hydantoinase B/oxoprolinase family protein [Planctomycetota bacterium]|nr:MAG: hydantoinase B/oxoprolinase family protein [Planctomycetota bacterium]